VREFGLGRYSNYELSSYPNHAGYLLKDVICDLKVLSL
jgi:hypothetical protein